MELHTVEWKNDSVVMIDQTKLPNELVFVKYTDYNDIAEAIRTLVVRGAPAIGVSGAFGIALAALQSSSETKEDLLSDIDSHFIFKKVNIFFMFFKLKRFKLKK